MRSFVPVAVHFGKLRVCFSGGNPNQNQRASTAVRPIISFRSLDDGAIKLEIEAPQIPRDELEGKRNAELVKLGRIAALVEGGRRRQGDAMRVGWREAATIRVIGRSSDPVVHARRYVVIVVQQQPG